jgi:hypothetical protein
MAFLETTLILLIIVSFSSFFYTKYNKESRLGIGFIYFSLINIDSSILLLNYIRASLLLVLISKPILLSSLPRVFNYSYKETDKFKILISLFF